MPVRVVIAEDEWLTAAVLRTQVESHGYEVVGTAGTGAEALDLCSSHAPDVVLMDVQMPGMDGLEATRTLMGRAPTCVVIVTGRARLSQEAEQAGAMSCVLKPVADSHIPFLVESSRQRFQLFLRVREQVGDPEEALRVWLRVQRALRAQMGKQGLSEESAFCLIERRATQDGASLLDAAEALLAESGGSPPAA